MPEQEDLTGSQPDEDAAAQGDSVVPIKMEGDGPLVVRQKFHHAKPISIDQALLEMELVGHDFYLFHDIEEDAPSVVYRRHGYQYGVIRLIENSPSPGLGTESPPAGLGRGSLAGVGRTWAHPPAATPSAAAARRYCAPARAAPSAMEPARSAGAPKARLHARAWS